MKRFLFGGCLTLLGALFCNSQSVSLLEEDLLNQTDFFVVSESFPGLFNASKDAFLKASAYNFSQAWFKVRGYDSGHTTVTINGIKMNKLFDNRPQWSNWGGLNDIFKPTSFSTDLNANETAFGDLLGSTNFVIRASHFNPMVKLSVASSNRSYTSRIMGSYASGKTRKGTALVVSASKRSGNEGFITATSYEAISGMIAVEKILNTKNSINLMVMGAWNVRGKSSPNTHEVTRLKGYHYNAYWGYQNGKKRNSRLKNIFEPIAILSHFYESEKVTLSTSLGFQKGHIGTTRVGYYNARNPSPDYYQNLPSYFLRNSRYPDYENAFKATENLIDDGQLDWKSLYQINRNTQTANYYWYEDSSDDSSIHFNTNLFAKLNDNYKLNAGLNFIGLTSNSYAELLDLLGSDHFVDLQGFETGEAKQNDLNNPNRAIFKGDKFLYSYGIRSNRWGAFTQLLGTHKRIDYFLGLKLSALSVQRTGKFKNGTYPESSYGKGKQQRFLDPSFKAGITYKFTGRHLLELKGGFISKAPPIKNMFTNIRISNGTPQDLNSEKILTTDLNYHLRLKKLISRVTAFYTQFTDGMATRFFFAQGLNGDNADFINETITAISRKHIGIEWSMNYQLNPSLKLSAAGTYGRYTYTKNPNVFIESDFYTRETGNFGQSYLKGYHVGGTHQKAFSLGFEYNDPDFWWLQINGNFLMDNYLEVSSLIRTSNFFLDADGLPYIDEDTGRQVTADQVNSLLVQKKLDDVFLLNMVGGKSWKFDNVYLSFFIGINNALGALFRTGGFEQSRYVSYPQYKLDQQRDKPLFGPKFWYGNPTTYFINLSVKY